MYIWFHNNIDDVLSKEQQDLLIEMIEETPPLPENIYSTMEKYFPVFYSLNSWNYKFKEVMGVRDAHCQCSEIYFYFIPGEPIVEDRRILIYSKDLMIRLFLEQNFTQKECYAFNMSILGFGSNTRGITEAAQFYFNKELDELTEEEIIGLYFISKAPITYSPVLNKENYDIAVKNVMDHFE